MIAGVVLALLGSAPAAHAPAPDQEPAPAQEVQEAQEESELDKLVRVARTGRPAFRPQAARRLVERGAPAAARLLEECGETNRDLAALGSALVEVLAEFDEPRLRAKAWTAVDDHDFPWRPAAARGLAVRPEASEAARIGELCSDAIAPVRHAAVLAVRALGREGEIDHVSVLAERLADPEGRVRRAAAAGLAARGEAWALWWLVAELERDDLFFDRPDGKIARYDAVRELEGQLDDLHGYDAEEPPTGNVAALAAIRASLRESAGEPRELPAVARPRTTPVGAVLGLELRSCRFGEVFLRWGADDVLWVGTGNPARIELPAGTVRALVSAAREELAAVGERRFWGQPGCDLEQLHFRPEAGGPVTTLILSKGPDAVQDLRPAPLTRLATLLVTSLPVHPAADPRIADLRRRARAALTALGGPLD